MADNINETVKFEKVDNNKEVESILKNVYEALTEKGYNPDSQIIGYILSGDPTYITSHKNARTLMRQLGRDQILEVLLDSYFDVNGIRN